MRHEQFGQFKFLMRADITKTSTEPFQGPKKTIFTSELLLPLSWNMNCHFFSFFFFNFFQFFAFLYENLRNFYTRFFHFSHPRMRCGNLAVHRDATRGRATGATAPPRHYFCPICPPPLRFLEIELFVTMRTKSVYLIDNNDTRGLQKSWI